MSADNYLLLRCHPQGGFTVTMEFASENEVREVSETDPRFESPFTALGHAYAWEGTEIVEYGVHVTFGFQQALEEWRNKE